MREAAVIRLQATTLIQPNVAAFEAGQAITGARGVVLDHPACSNSALAVHSTP